jgi:hypothetical protein
MRPSAKMIPHKSQRPSAKAIPSLSVKLPDIHPTKVLLIKDKFPNRFMFPPVTVAPNLNISKPSAKTTNPLA